MKIKGRVHDEISALQSLNRKKSISIVNKTIFVDKDNIDCGNKTWGIIDYLTHYCGYFAQWKDREVKSSMINRRLNQ